MLHWIDSNHADRLTDLRTSTSTNSGASSDYSPALPHRPSSRIDVPLNWIRQAENIGLNRPDDPNQAPVHLAALHMGHDSLDDLLSRGANPNVKDGRGRTPLHHAAYYGYADNVQALLAAGADPNARDNEGWTPLNAANSGRNDRLVMKILRAAGGKRQSWLGSLLWKSEGPAVNT